VRIVDRAGWILVSIDIGDGRIHPYLAAASTPKGSAGYLRLVTGKYAPFEAANNNCGAGTSPDKEKPGH
jgi:hypothetical protein